MKNLEVNLMLLNLLTGYTQESSKSDLNSESLDTLTIWLITRKFIFK